MTNGLTVLLFCDVCINIGTTLNLLRCLRVGCWANITGTAGSYCIQASLTNWSIVTIIISLGSPLIFLKSWFIIWCKDLCCVATGSAYKMIWTATQCRNKKNIYSCVASLSKSFYRISSGTFLNISDLLAQIIGGKIQNFSRNPKSAE